MLEQLKEMKASGRVVNQEDIDKLLPATRASSSNERMGRKNNDANIVDPFGRRTPRRGLRERAMDQRKAVLERMEAQVRRSLRSPEGCCCFSERAAAHLISAV